MHFLQSSDTAHSLDAGFTVTRVVHGRGAEPQRVGCRREQHCCGKVIESPDCLLQISCPEFGQELADPLKSALVHEDRPVADSFLGTPVSEVEITTDQHGRSSATGWDEIFLSQRQKL